MTLDIRPYMNEHGGIDQHLLKCIVANHFGLKFGKYNPPAVDSAVDAKTGVWFGSCSKGEVELKWR